MREGIWGAKSNMSSFVKMNRESGQPGRDVLERERWARYGPTGWMYGWINRCMGRKEETKEGRKEGGSVRRVIMEDGAWVLAWGVLSLSFRPQIARQYTYHCGELRASPGPYSMLMADFPFDGLPIPHVSSNVASFIIVLKRKLYDDTVFLKTL